MPTPVPQDNGKWATAPWPNPLGKPSHPPTGRSRVETGRLYAGFQVQEVFKEETTSRVVAGSMFLFNFHFLWMVTSICCFFNFHFRRWLPASAFFELSCIHAFHETNRLPLKIGFFVAKGKFIFQPLFCRGTSLGQYIYIYIRLDQNSHVPEGMYTVYYM